MENLEEEIVNRIREIEKMIQQNVDKSEIAMRRKELDELLNQYLEDL